MSSVDLLIKALKKCRNNKKAIVICKKLVDEYSFDYYKIPLARYYYLNDEYDKAVHILEKMENSSERDKLLCFNYMKINRLEEAYNLAVQYDVNDLIILILLLMGKWQKIVEYFDNDLTDTDLAYLCKLTFYHKNQISEEIINALRTYIKDSPNIIDDLYNDINDSKNLNFIMQISPYGILTNPDKLFECIENLDSCYLPLNKIDETDPAGNTLLMHAIQHNEIELIKKLLYNGANVLHVNKLGQTSLDMARKSSDEIHYLILKRAIIGPRNIDIKIKIENMEKLFNKIS
jgi:hypothetical protein